MPIYQIVLHKFSTSLTSGEASITDWLRSIYKHDAHRRLLRELCTISANTFLEIYCFTRCFIFFCFVYFFYKKNLINLWNKRSLTTQGVVQLFHFLQLRLSCIQIVEFRLSKIVLVHIMTDGKFQKKHLYCQSPSYPNIQHYGISNYEQYNCCFLVIFSHDNYRVQKLPGINRIILVI